MDRRFYYRIMRGAAFAIVIMFVGAYLAFPILIPIEELIVASTSPVLRLHTPGMIRFYLRQMRLIDPQYRTDDGLTLLQFTLNAYQRNGDPKTNLRCLETAAYLIERGVPLDAADSELGMTALHHAIVNGEPDVAAFLLEHGADPGVAVKAGEGKYAGKTPDELARRQLEVGKFTAAEVATLEKQMKAVSRK